MNLKKNEWVQSSFSSSSKLLVYWELCCMVWRALFTQMVWRLPPLHLCTLFLTRTSSCVSMELSTMSKQHQQVYITSTFLATSFIILKVVVSIFTSNDPVCVFRNSAKRGCDECGRYKRHGAHVTHGTEPAWTSPDKGTAATTEIGHSETRAHASRAGYIQLNDNFIDDSRPLYRSDINYKSVITYKLNAFCMCFLIDSKP